MSVIMTTIVLRPNVDSIIKSYAKVANLIGKRFTSSLFAEQLIGLQMKMKNDIMIAYGIHAGRYTYIEEIIGAKVVTMLNEANAFYSKMMFPGIVVIYSAMNASVASGITYAIGKGLIDAADMICENNWEDDANKIEYAIKVSIKTFLPAAVG